MSDSAGPWGHRDGAGEGRTSSDAPDAPSGREGAPEAGPVGNLVSTALLAALLWWWWRDWVLVGAAIMGVFVHEFGHVLAMNALGCGPARMRIVPFLGGAAIPARPPATEFRDVLIALSGPVFGLLAILPFWIAAEATGSPSWLKGGVVIAAINLFNLVPAPPLDGSKALGPVLARIHPMVEKAVIALVGAVAVIWLVLRHDWFIALFIGLSVFAAIKRSDLRPRAVRLNMREQALGLAAWLGAGGLCAAAIVMVLQGLGMDASPGGLLSILGLR